MSLSLYNTLTRRKEELIPRTTGEVSLYTCGPTVYDRQHIGNYRKYVFDDTLIRWLEQGHKCVVDHVMNITDVDDKIIERSKAKTNEAMAHFIEPFEKGFREDLIDLNIKEPRYTRATENIEEMQRMIRTILQKGYAYERDGSIYFDVRKYHKDYGYNTLVKVDFVGFAQHHRIDNDEYDKENVQDFALWKSESPDKPGWPFTLAKKTHHGRPGWHIECSAMVHAAFDGGEPLDAHSGGVDNKFPHHQNEIAQTKIATGKQLAKFWLHSELLLVDGAKMAKSKKNFFTPADVAREYELLPKALRFLYLQSHYRSKLDFTEHRAHSASKRYKRLQEFLLVLSEASESREGLRQQVYTSEERIRTGVREAMNDDLNTPQALAIINNEFRALNVLRQEYAFSIEEARKLQDVFDWLDNIFGIYSLEASTEVPIVIKDLANERKQLKNEGKLEAADRLREKVEDLGFNIEDTPDSYRLRKKPQ